MGYTTEFRGGFTFDKPLSEKMQNYLTNFAETRRMGRNVDEAFGTEGEFFVFGGGFGGQDSEKSIIDYNKPPKTQPSLWCQWVPNEDGTMLEWDGNEKFYCYIEWLFYLVNKIIAPNGYVLNGNVRWRGEDFDDAGVIELRNNVMYVNNKKYDKSTFENYVGYGKYEEVSMELEKVLILDNVDKLLETK